MTTSSQRCSKEKGNEGGEADASTGPGTIREAEEVRLDGARAPPGADKEKPLQRPTESPGSPVPQAPRGDAGPRAVRDAEREAAAGDRRILARLIKNGIAWPEEATRP